MAVRSEKLLSSILSSRKTCLASRKLAVVLSFSPFITRKL